MNAKEICDLAKSDEHLKSYFQELFTTFENYARTRAKSKMQSLNYDWDFEYVYIDRKYFKMNAEQKQYLESLGFKITIENHPTRTFSRFVKTKFLFFQVYETVPVQILTIEACCESK